MPSSMGRTVKPLITLLPDDIIINILKRLPVKSLIQLQCVCKHWKNLIRTRSFIAQHLHHSSLQNPLLLFRWPRLMSPGFHWVLLDRDRRGRVIQSSQISLIDSLPHLSIHGSSNGLLCLKSASANPILLWNPATREIRLVPITINCFGGTCSIAFGFSPIVNDYKIVVIYDQCLDNVWRVYLVKVYSLCTKSWKEIEFGNLEGLYVSPHSISANGRAFWLGIKGEDEECCSVVSFDLANEVFTVIPLPASDDTFVKRLTVYENNLALIGTEWIAWSEHCIKMWVREEGSGTSGERWCWTHKYTSSICSGWTMLYPITIWGDEIICEPEFESDSEGEDDDDDDPITSLYMFNIASNEFRIFSIPDCDEVSSLIIDHYVESLVPIGNIQVENP